MPGVPSSEAERVARSWFDAVNAHDPDAIASTLAPDFTWTLWDATTTGRDVSREAWQLIFEGLPDYRMTILDMVVDGAKVVTRCAIDGTHSGPLRFRGTKSMDAPFSATGRRFHVPDAVSWMEVEAGLLRVNRAYWRPEHMLQQLGIAPR